MLNHPIPKTGAEIAGLQLSQQNQQFHPLTCPKRNDDDHRTYAAMLAQPDHGILIATPFFWLCPVCLYQQAYRGLDFARPGFIGMPRVRDLAEYKERLPLPAGIHSPDCDIFDWHPGMVAGSKPCNCGAGGGV